ncbi:carboxypeptidase-like regulatory domain-containing protein [Nonlabens antarcticus]|uniref:carboxypeptidase-like regulatory domain-containing protein n=1 Tax=Nonlabens antarcticus TaxID=392714 RepID=UPI0018917D49|nr:carboxypeptidase-like regulatory domain-containing protein [Nonlabens antarcticus]
MRAILVFLSLFLSLTSLSQDFKISGKIVDASSGEPLTGVAVYISGTSTGVVSDLDGKYSITYSPEFNAPLVFAYLGYEKIEILDPKNVNLSLIKMSEQTNNLDAIVIDPDPWDRATKEALFLKYFVGIRSLEDCKILNLKDVRLRFNTKTKQLTAVSNNPILLTNDYLGYSISYDLSEFEINFRFLKNNTGLEKTFLIEHRPDRYVAENSFVAGTSFYQELDSKRPSERRRNRRREKAYELAQLKLYRSIIHETMTDDKFDLHFNGFRVNPEDHIRVRAEADVFKLTFRNLKYSIKDRDDNQTDLYLTSHIIYIDKYGNNLSPRDIMLSGYIPQLGIGGMLPLNYN